MRVHWILGTLILSSVYIESGSSVHEASHLILTVLKVLDRGVVLRWEGMDMKSVMDCELNFSCNHTELWTIIDYTPMNFSFTVPDLQPATFYKFVLVCHDNTNGKHTSQPVHFSTPYEGTSPGSKLDNRAPALSTVASLTPRIPMDTHSSVITPAHNSTNHSQVKDTNTTPANPSFSSSSSTTTTPTLPPTTIKPTKPPRRATPVPTSGVVTSVRRPTHRPTKTSTLEGGAVLETETSPMDIGLGIAFGFIGCGVFAMMAYFCIKEYRRRMRIRRFLQYRQQENEPFPDMDNDDDEGIVM